MRHFLPLTLVLTLNIRVGKKRTQSPNPLSKSDQIVGLRCIYVPLLIDFVIGMIINFRVYIRFRKITMPVLDLSISIKEPFIMTANDLPALAALPSTNPGSSAFKLVVAMWANCFHFNFFNSNDLIFCFCSTLQTLLPITVLRSAGIISERIAAI